MPCVVTMKDMLVQETVDEDFVQAMNQLNMASAKGMSFMTMDDMDGGHVMFNIGNILTIKELHD